MQADSEKELCFFVGGNGNKIGTAIAGGCTKAWLGAQNGDPSALFGPDGGCIYSSPAIQIGTNSRIAGPAGAFAGVQVGMAAWIDANNFSSGYYEVTAVGSQYEYVEFAGADEIYMPETISVYIGGAFDCLATALHRSAAYYYDGFVLTNKSETLIQPLTGEVARWSIENNTFLHVIGYHTSVLIENGQVVSDMDPANPLYQSSVDVLQNGVSAGKKVIVDGSAMAAHVVSLQAVHCIFRNFHIKAGAGYSCVQPTAGNQLQFKGFTLDNCILEGGQNGVKTSGILDCMICRNCIALNCSGYGFNLLVTDNGGKSGVLEHCIADGCGTGFAASGGAIVQGCIAEDCTKGIESNGSIQVSACVLYNCLEAAFVCSAVTTRWEIFNTIAVLNENAAGVFKVGPNRGNIVYEDYNCFIDRLGNPVTLHDQSTWPAYNYNPPEIGVHTLQSSPLFVSIAGKDYRLQAGSPCVNAGRPVLYGIKTHIGLYEAAESVPGGGNNAQVNVNVQYGSRNKQYS